MKKNREIVEIDEALCDGCGQCVGACAESAIEIVNGKARLKAERYCDGLGACLGECPRGALKIIVREADDFDEAAVHELIAQEKREQELKAAHASAGGGGKLPCGCPGSQVMDLRKPAGCPSSAAKAAVPVGESALGHWPVKLRLVPPAASFLQGAHVLLAADCAPVALPGFNPNVIQGKAALIACPKFEDAEATAGKIRDILLNARPSKLTVMRMEVPCCMGLTRLVREAAGAALAESQGAAELPDIEEVVVGRDGRIVEKNPLTPVKALSQILV